ncbi:hypothetical protein BD779DRAFT_1423976, partial [Infundibulicybe gibba]
PRLRDRSSNKSAPTPAPQRKEKAAERQVRQREIDAAVREWFASTLSRADDLAQRFNKKPQHFLDLFFQGGAHMINHRSKTNPFNAFKSAKAKEINAATDYTIATGTGSMNLLEIQDEYQDEYNALSKEEKDQLVEDFRNNKEAALNLRRPTAKARIQDVANVVRNMQELLSGLSRRVGIEAFFCIVRHNSDFHMKPQWYFSSPELAEYMKVAARGKWVTSDIGFRIEAFAIAGCD